MDTISFRSVLPHIFANRSDLHSEVWSANLTFEKGKKYLVEADSGQGKSTFCSYLIGYRHDYSGTIMMDQRETKSFSTQDWITIRKQHISHLFQELRLFPELTAFENVEIKNKLTNFKKKEEILHCFEMLGINDKVNSPIGLMSFGQQQRVAMIRAFVQPFDFIVVDEPISHLDNTNAEIMGKLLIEEAQKQRAGVIVTSIGKHMQLNYDQLIKL